MTLMWVVLAPVVLVLLLFVALYIPPVQKWAVDKAAETLSEEMGWKVSVERVLLKFPLDLSIGGVKAIEDEEGNAHRGEYILDSEELTLTVSILPLFHGEVAIDEVRLTNTDLNTFDLIPSVVVSGHVGELSTRQVSMLLETGSAVVPELNLKHSDLQVVIPDSVPEDTTEESEEPPFLKSIDVKNININDVAFRLVLPPSAAPTTMNTLLGNAHVTCQLDLENGNYYVNDLNILDSRLNYDTSLPKASITSALFDANHIGLDSISISVDSAAYLATGDIYAHIKHISANEQCGLSVNELNGTFRMNDKQMTLDQFTVSTPNSSVKADMQMDLNAFDEVDPGSFTVNASGNVGLNDIMPFAQDYASVIGKSLGGRSLTFDINADGNLQSLNVGHLSAVLPGALTIKASGTLTDLLNPDGNIGADMTMNVKGGNMRFIKDFLPADVRNSFNIPNGTSLDGSVSMLNGLLKANVKLGAGKSLARLIADYNINTSAYRVDLDARQFRIDHFVPLAEPAMVTGRVRAKGQGFDFDSPRTYTDADANIKFAQYGDYYLTNAAAVGSLKRHTLGVNIDTDDPRLQSHITLDGTMTGKDVDADLVLDLPFADAKALGLSADPLTATATHGTMKASSNFGDLFLVDMTVQGVQVAINEKDSLVTDLFDVYAQSTADSTAITAKTGDFYFDLHSPNNLFRLIEQYQKVGTAATEQMKNRALSLDKLKEIMPVAELHANIGSDNPISKFLALQGYRYGEVVADLRTSKEYGLQGGAHAYNFYSDSIKIDTVYFDIQQDSTHLALRSGVACSEQEALPAFTAHVNGNMSPRDADLRLDFFDGNGKQGLDLGLLGVIGEDSVLHMRMYPEQPIIGFTKFNVNPDNYIDVHKHNRVFADVFLQSASDSCNVSIKANPDDEQMQNVMAVIKNLNLEQLLTIMPFAPKMAGNIGLTANYVQTTENYSVEGMVSADNFTYESVWLGNLLSSFHYQPTGEAGHNISAQVYQNSNLVAVVGGTYNAEGDNHVNASVMLMQLPAASANAFIPDQLCGLSGVIDGQINVNGPVDSLRFNGNIYPTDLHVFSDIYSFDLRVGNEPIVFTNSHLTFNGIKIFGAHDNPLTITGYVDFADFDNIQVNLSLYGNDFAVFDAPRTRKSALFGTLYGNFFAHVTGSTDDLKIRGMVNVLKSTDITYIMTNTPLSVGYRLDDIVTFVDFSAPQEETQRVPKKFTGVDMQMSLEIEDGARVNCEFSADKQSYVNVQGGGTIRMTYTPEGVLSLVGRYTVNEGEMKYTLPVIPLKTFTIKKGSYIEFAGEAMNPILNIEATEETKAGVSNDDGSSRSVLFNTGLRITNTLSNMGLEFTIDAPEDIAVQNELAGMTAEEKNKLAVALLATGMYLSTNNETGFSASNALNQFLQSEINNIAGRALSSAIDVDMTVGLEQSKRDDGTTRTDYSFKFTKRFFSDRLNVVLGGKVSTGDNSDNSGSAAYIDDISLEWRLDDGGTQYIRLFHDKNYNNLVEGELTENGAGVVLRKKVDKFSDLLIWKRDSNKRKNNR